MGEHIPVLLNEVIEGLNINPDGTYLDLTLGRGGHSSKILSKLSSKGLLIGVDQDPTAIKESKERLLKIGSNFVLEQTNFKNLDQVLYKLNVKEVDGILIDLGVSSPQFDEASRGFSYRADAVLDMRMDPSNSLTAEYIVNNYSLKDLSNVFRNYGEDKYSYQIAKNIIKLREEGKFITTTEQLVEVIKASKPQKELAKKGHPAKQIFQALRIEVNDELGVLKIALEKALKFLKINGRLAVISFHSLEDKIVKYYFNQNSTVIGDRKNDFILPSEIETANYKLVNKKPIIPTELEMNNNPRSKSAKLRIIERIK